MSQATPSAALIPVPNLRAYFHQALREAAESRRIDADEGILAYLSELLTDYARPERLFDHTGGGMVRRPLVELYRQANEADSVGERELSLRDLALFVSGILPHSLDRGLVGLDYYIAKGSSAYGSLCGSSGGGGGARIRTLRAVFAQLSGRFVEFVDLLAETVEPGLEDRAPGPHAFT